MGFLCVRARVLVLVMGVLLNCDVGLWVCTVSSNVLRASNDTHLHVAVNIVNKFELCTIFNFYEFRHGIRNDETRKMGLPEV